METNKESFIKVVQGAREAGIPDEDIKGYLSLEKSIKEEHKEIWSKLLKENDLYMSSITEVKDQKTFIKEIMGEKVQAKEGIQQMELSEKSKMLLDKIELLAQKIEEERNPLKRHILAFQVKMLIAKIQREIDLQNIRADYEDKRAELLAEKDERESRSLDKIAVLNGKIRAKQREIGAYEEYDVDSPYFLYPKSYVERVGGVQNLTQKLKESNQKESQLVAQKIEDMTQKRQELQQLQSELQQAQEGLEYSQYDYETEGKALHKEENALVLKQRFNIFARIGNFFKTLVEEMKLYREEKKQIKEFAVQQKGEETAIDDEFNARLQKLDEEYEQARKELLERQQKEKEEKREQLGKDTAANFRQQMSEMAKGENTEISQEQGKSEPAQTQGKTEVEETVIETGDDGIEH